jgi:hypothetical protein
MSHRDLTDGYSFITRSNAWYDRVSSIFAELERLTREYARLKEMRDAILRQVL